MWGMNTCMYFSRNKVGELAIWLSWIDDNLIVEPSQVMKDEGKKLGKEIKIEDVGKLKEFVGSKIKIDKLDQSTKFTQSLMIQSFLDEFSAGKKKQVTPAEPNTVLKRPEHSDILANKDQSKYQLGIRKLMHRMKWSWPDIYNATKNCARHMMLAGRTHYDAMVPVMNYREG